MRPLLLIVGTALLVFLFIVAFGNFQIQAPFIILTNQTNGPLTFPILLMAFVGFLSGASFAAAAFFGKKDEDDDGF